MRRYHYVYKLTNTLPVDKRKYYIGCRSCDCDPMSDKYFGSSKEIKRIIKENGNFFTKEILKIFTCRKDAINYEIELHTKFSVSSNEEFYNKVKQSSTGFDTSGIIFIDGVAITSDEYKISNVKYHSKGKITLKDSEGKMHWVDVDDVRYKNGELINLTKGSMPICVNNSYENITIKEYYKNKEKYTPTNIGKVPVADESGNRFLISKNDERYKNKEVVSLHKGKILSKDINGNVKYVYKDEFIKNNLTGINKGNISGSDNPNSKLIKIYDNNDNLIFECDGNFKQTCKDNNLPFISLYRSYKNNGSKIYNTKRGEKEAHKKGNYRFIGWFAILSNKPI